MDADLRQSTKLSLDVALVALIQSTSLLHSALAAMTDPAYEAYPRLRTGCANPIDFSFPFCTGYSD